MEQEDFRGNVTPPPRSRPSVTGLLGNALLALVVLSGLVGALLLAGPALDVNNLPSHQGSEAAKNR